MSRPKYGELTDNYSIWEKRPMVPNEIIESDNNKILRLYIETNCLNDNGIKTYEFPELKQLIISFFFKKEKKIRRILKNKNIKSVTIENELFHYKTFFKYLLGSQISHFNFNSSYPQICEKISKINSLKILEIAALYDQPDNSIEFLPLSLFANNSLRQLIISDTLKFKPEIDFLRYFHPNLKISSPSLFYGLKKYNLELQQLCNLDGSDSSCKKMNNKKINIHYKTELLDGVIRNNKLVGTWKLYYPNGQLKQVRYYFKGKPFRKWVLYNVNGSVKMTINQWFRARPKLVTYLYSTSDEKMLYAKYININNKIRTKYFNK